MAPYTLPPRDVCPSAAAEVEAYAREKDLDGLFRALTSRVFRERPSYPVDFVFAALAERYPDRAAARGWTTLAPNHPPPDHPDAGARVTVTHPDPEASAYLNRHLAVACLFETVADRLVEDPPARPLAHVVHLLALADRDDHHHPTTTPSRDDAPAPAPAPASATRDDEARVVGRGDVRETGVRVVDEGIGRETRGRDRAETGERSRRRRSLTNESSSAA